MISKVLIALLLASYSLHSKFEVITEDRPIEINMMPKDSKEAVMRFSPSKKFEFEKNGFVIAAYDEVSLNWNVHANISYFKASGVVAHRSTIGKAKTTVGTWQLLYLDNFSNGDKNNWQGAMTEIKPCGPSKDKSLFRDCKTKIDYIEKKFVNLGPHTAIMVEMMIHFIDQWEGELAYLQIGEDIVWTKSHNWCNTIFNHRCMLNGVNVCEDAYPDLVGQHVKYIYKHDKPDVTIRIGTSLTKDNCKATWGMNNFMLYVR